MTELSTSPLLATKLYIPQARQSLVKRLRLTNFLNNALARTLTLVSAPAGFGKTTLIAEWIAQTHPNVAWVSLDERDNDLARFFAYFIAALQTINANIGATSLALIQAQAAQPATIETPLTILLNELVEIPDEFLLILDDYHLIRAQPIHNALAFLLEHLPPQMHTVLIARADPPFSVARLRVRNQLLELRAADLRFTTEEAAAFLNDVMRLNISSAQVAALEARTEGWIAGLQLAALSMQGRGDVRGFIDAFAGSNRLVLNYLIEEVLQRQSAEVQDFLLHTSILDRFTAELCDVITQRTDSRAQLDAIEQANLFLIPLDDQGKWYRYHHLFADTLRARLQQSEPGRVPELHRRASEWFAKKLQPTDAVTHALAAHDLNRASEYIVEFYGMMYTQNALPTLIEWIRVLPDEIIQARPRLALIAAWAMLATSHIEEAEHLLQNIERHYGVNADVLMTDQAGTLAPETRAALVELTILRASMTMPQFDFNEKIRRLQRIRHWLTDDAPTVNNTPKDLRPIVAFNMALAHELVGNSTEASEAFAQAITGAQQTGNFHIISMSLSHSAQLQLIQGQLHRAAETYRSALLPSSTSFLTPFVGLAHAGLGCVLYEWNDLDAALEEYEEGIEQGKLWNNWETLMPAYAGVAYIQYVRDDSTSALSTIDELANLVSKAGMPVIVPTVEASRADIHARCGDLETARRWADACDLRSADAIPYFRESEGITLARVLLALNRTDEANRLLGKLFANASASNRNGNVITILALQSIAFDKLGQDAAAQDALKHALTLAEPEGYIRTFLDGGKAMPGLLAQIDSAYARKLLSMTTDRRPPTARESAVVGLRSSVVLSARELEVLRLIIDGLSNQEIANKLVISIRTVKKHIENIYGKLEVQTRTQAIAKARELKLF